MAARAWPLLTIVAVMGLMMLLSLPHTSPVYDEPFHLTRGMAVWWTGETRLAYDHPPLGNAIEGLFALPVIDEPYAFEDTNAWGQAAYKPLASAWQRDHYDSFAQGLAWARVGVVLMSLALVVVVHRFCARVYDRRTAAWAALLLASQPVVLAHGRFVTTDMPETLAMMLAVAAFCRYLERTTIGWAMLTSIAVAGAMLVKFTGLVLLPVFGALTLVVAAVRRPRWLGRAVLHLLAGGVVVCLLVSAAYRFEDTGFTVHDTIEQPVERSLEGHRRTTGDSMLARLPSGLRIPLPRRYVLGAMTTARRASYGRGTFFMGQAYDRGTPWFFVVLLPLKLTPALVLALVTAAGVRLRGRGLPRLATVVVVTLAAALLIGAVRSRLNLGFRHMLPLLPLLAILAARGLSLAWEGAGRWGRRLVAALLLTAPVGALYEFPHYLGYFNVFIGGRDQGHRITLVGEDWGQDVVALTDWWTEHDQPPLAYHPYVPMTGASEARHRGLHFRELRCRDPLPATMIAVHAVVVQRGKCFPQLQLGQQDDEINAHILVFDRRPAAAR